MFKKKPCHQASLFLDEQSSDLMATAPIKSQPLHNFPLSHLRWAHKPHHHPPPPHSTLHSFRRRDSPENDASKLSSRAPRKPPPVPSFSACNSHQNPKPGKNDVVGEGESENEPKPWNLRPRKVVSLLTAAATTSFRKGEKEKLQEENNESDLKSSRARGTVGGSGGMVVPGFYGTERQQRKVVEEKRKFWISLSKEEIEEDVYSLTGSRPSRRPKKRPRNVQKQLDNVFPGMYLVGLTVDSYRSHDSLR